MCIIFLFSIIPGLVGQGYYKYARKSIESGIIKPNYAIYNFFDGVVLVDENNKKILVNKTGVRDFNEIKEIHISHVTSESNVKNTNLTIVFKTGNNPVETVNLKDGKNGEAQYHRLSNSLGFSSI